MFTMKKLAILAVSGFIAASMLACTEEEGSEDDGGNKLSIPDGYAHSKVVTLGGKGNSTDGSFLDADGSITVSLSGSAEKDKIDLVFDGTNLFSVSYYDTPAGESALGSSKLKGGEPALIWSYTGDESPTKVVEFISDRYDADDIGSPNFVPSAGKKYAVFTTDGIFALVKVDAVSADALVASVGNFDVE